MWSDVFLHEDPYSGEKFAIVVMDTQGLFDNKASGQEGLKIFALSTLLSSFLALNLNDVIQENQLDYLQTATNYGRLVYEISGTAGKAADKPFQSLLFLIRDWMNENEFPLGLQGGPEYVQKF